MNEEPLIDTKNFRQAKVPQDLIPGFSEKSPEVQKQALNQVKDFIGQQSNPPFETDVVDEELNKVDNKTAQNDNGGDEKDKKSLKDKEDKDEKVKFAGAATAGSNSGGFRPSNQVNSSSNSNASSFVGSGSSSVSGGGKISKLDKQAKAYNDAKLKMYENDGLDNSRGPASIDDIIVSIQPGGPLKVSDDKSNVPKLLIDIDKKDDPNFNDIHKNKSDFERYLSKTIKGLEGKQLADEFDLVLVGELDKQNDKKQTFFTVRVTRGPSGEYVASVLDVDRSVKLETLRMELLKK